MTSASHLVQQVDSVQQQFTELLSHDALDMEAGIELLQQLEHLLLTLAADANLSSGHISADDSESTGNLPSELEYLKRQLGWLAAQVELLQSEQAQISEQLLQLSRAKKGNASYDEHKEY